MNSPFQPGDIVWLKFWPSPFLVIRVTRLSVVMSRLQLVQLKDDGVLSTGFGGESIYTRLSDDEWPNAVIGSMMDFFGVDWREKLGVDNA